MVGLLLLVLMTVGLLIYSFIAKNKITLKLLAWLWVFTIFIIVVGSIMNNYSTLIRLTKQDIIGDYKIDTTFYPGKNAKWQYEHYRFTITGSDSLYFYITHKDTIAKTIKVKLKFSNGPPDLWRVDGITAYHVIKYPPTLYRGYNKFYYVFHSDMYGNMFFRKENE